MIKTVCQDNFKKIILSSNILKIYRIFVTIHSRFDGTTNKAEL